MRERKGFTLIELMVVILIVGILAAVAVPMMRGRIDSAKWSEGAATAGSIRTAVRTYAAEHGITQANVDLVGKTADTVLAELGFAVGDLQGTYFTNPNAFTITSINATTGIGVITVDGTTAGLTGTRVLNINGDFI
jgi:prepilin-type N-terminal cleavage/methylation domain-containing protein